MSILQVPERSLVKEEATGPQDIAVATEGCDGNAVGAEGKGPSFGNEFSSDKEAIYIDEHLHSSTAG